MSIKKKIKNTMRHSTTMNTLIKKLNPILKGGILQNQLPLTNDVCTGGKICMGQSVRKDEKDTQRNGK
jgi:hypothetical protein